MATPPVTRWHAWKRGGIHSYSRRLPRMVKSDMTTRCTPGDMMTLLATWRYSWRHLRRRENSEWHGDKSGDITDDIITWRHHWWYHYMATSWHGDIIHGTINTWRHHWRPLLHGDAAISRRRGDIQATRWHPWQRGDIPGDVATLLVTDDVFIAWSRRRDAVDVQHERTL